MMQHQKKVRRLVLFVEQLKQGTYPNAASFAGHLRQLDLKHNENVAVSPKTVKRDIAFLKDTLGAPIVYDSSERGYCLLDHSWTFPYLWLQGDDLFAALFSERVSQHLVPPPLQHQIDSLMAVQLAAGEPADISPELFNSLVVATHGHVAVEDDVFEAVTTAWRTERRLRIAYSRPDQEECISRDVDVHALFLSDGAWYVRAYCHLRKGLRSLALHRIDSAELLSERFMRRDSVAESMRSGQVFDYELVTEVEVDCTAEKAPIISERDWFPGQQIKHRGDHGGIRLRFPEVPRPSFVIWVLSYYGHLEVIQPEDLRDEVRDAAMQIAEVHRAYEE